MPLLLDAIKPLTGRGIQIDIRGDSGSIPVRVPPRGGNLYPPPFFGSCDDDPLNPQNTPVLGAGSKKKRQKKRGKGLLLRKNSPFKGIPIVRAIL